MRKFFNYVGLEIKYLYLKKQFDFLQCKYNVLLKKLDDDFKDVVL